MAIFMQLTDAADRRMRLGLFLVSCIHGLWAGIPLMIICGIMLWADGRFSPALAPFYALPVSCCLNYLWYYRPNVEAHEAHRQSGNSFYDLAVVSAMEDLGLWHMLTKNWFRRDLETIIEDG